MNKSVLVKTKYPDLHEFKASQSYTMKCCLENNNNNKINNNI